MVMVEGASQPRTSNVRATSDTTPRLVDGCVPGVPIETKRQSLEAFRTIPNALWEVLGASSVSCLHWAGSCSS